MRRRVLRAVTTIGFGAVLLAAVGCTSGTTVSSATGTGRPPSSPAAASSLSATPSSVGQAAAWPTYNRTVGRSGVSVSSPAPAGPPIIAGGVVWDVNRKGTLSGYRLSDGTSVFSAPTAPVVTDFPSLSASGSRLIVPEGDKVVSYLGI
jgi:hypothetical protein